jgi:hypothetical protein
MYLVDHLFLMLYIMPQIEILLNMPFYPHPQPVCISFEVRVSPHRYVN